MGTVRDPKRTVTAEMVSEPQPVDPGASDNEPALDTRLASVTAPQERSGNLSSKSNDGGIKKSSDNSQPNKRRSSNTLTSPPGDHEKSASTSSTVANEKSTFTSSTEDHSKSIFPSSMADHEESILTCPTGKSTITSSTADHKKPEPSSRKDMETGRDLIGGCLSDVIEGHDDSSARVRVLPVAEKKDICKTSLSASSLTPSRPSSETNDTGGNVQSSTEVLAQLTESSAKDRSEYSQVPHSETNVRHRSDQVSHRTHAPSLAPTTKQEKTAEVRTSHRDASLSVQSRDYKDAARQPCVLPKSPVETGNRRQASEREATGSISGNPPQEKREKLESPEAERSKDVSVSSTTPAPAHKTGPSALKKEVSDSESTSRNHLSFQPLSHTTAPGGPLSKADLVATAGGALQTPGVAVEETHEAPRGPGSRYKEAATMTVSTEHRSTPKRDSHDAGVQAVASVCSRSVGTSPSLSSQGGPLKLNGVATEKRETLTVTCQRSSRSAPVYQITMDDSWSGQSGILSDVCSQTVVSSQIHRESSRPASKQICDRLPGQARLKAGQSNSQATGAIQHSEPPVKADGRGQGTTPKEPADTAQKWLPLLQPVYQINIEQCSQSDATSNPSPCDKESLVTDSTKIGIESAISRQQDARGCFPGNSSSDECRASAETVAPPTRPVKSPAVRSSPSHVHGLLPGALTVAQSQKDEEEAKPLALSTVTEGKQATGRLIKGPKQPAAKKEDGRTCKSAKSEAGGKKKKGSERGKTNPANGKKQSQSEGGGKASGQAKAKGIHDVVWDEQGMTWEVYGASADPESLGFAIQNHLQSKIKEQERLIKAQVERRKSEAPGSPAGKRTKRRQPRMLRSLMKNVRRPNCCSRPPPSSVLE